MSKNYATGPSLNVVIEAPNAPPLILDSLALAAAAIERSGVQAGYRWQLLLAPLANTPRLNDASGFSPPRHEDSEDSSGLLLRPSCTSRLTCWQVRLKFELAERAQIAFRVALAGLGPQPRWLMPANFYDQNRPADSPRRYPRWGFDDDLWSAPAWCFSAERAAAPFVSVVTAERAAALLAGSPYWGAQPIGLGLDAAGDTTLVLRYPFAETPRSDAPCRGDGCAPLVAWHTAQAGELLTLSFEIWLGPPEPLYPTLLRALDARRFSLLRHEDTEPLIGHSVSPCLRGEPFLPNSNHTLSSTNPWMPTDAAAALLAEGLLRWHYDPATAVLAETCAFDHYFRQSDRQTDRAAMHVAWLSGIPSAFALLRQGGAAEHAGRRVIDHISREGLAPCGAFWAQWTPQGWGTCWYGPPEGAPPWLQAATTAEATMFLLQAAAHEWVAGQPQPVWEQAARRNLDFVVARQRHDGNLGAYYDAQSGEVTLWDGSAGLLWIAPLVAGWRRWGDARLLDAALRAADYYAPQVLDDQLRGAPEDVPLGPTSMDGYCALRAYWDLYAATGERRWLDLARHAADWTLTFRWTYNVRFERRSFLGSLDFRTLGGDLASPSNQHLHVYGMIALPELLRLWLETSDDFYFRAAADLLGFARQTLARVDGEGNARRGMYTEQWYHVDWTHPKGTTLQLAHAWCNGLAIYGFQEARRFGELWVGTQVLCLEPGTLVDPLPDPTDIRLQNLFDTPLSLRVRLREPWHSLALDDAPIELQSDELGSYADIWLNPGEEQTLAAALV